ncbi:MAG: DNA-directed RNA polymerase subunit alpha [Thermodesulfobacteriota bacterium]|nr:DNA-directed RNA polymerase subunit alpha [Thermodesulfobacteriota bacterium]
MHINWHGLIRPKRLEMDTEISTNSYGKFVGEPFERGFGITLGNSLRRILLSSLVGTAITSVRIEGVLHEFSTIPGVREDVTDIILNLKEVLLRLHTEGPEIVKIDIDKEGEVKASNIITNNNVEVLNPDLHIATLAKNAKLKMEMEVKRGRGYVPAEKNKQEEDPIGAIPIDAIFSPVKKVNYVVGHARLGQRADYDKITIEVWTDGSILPEDAIAYAAKILKDQMDVFINFNDFEEQKVEEEIIGDEVKESVVNENLYRSIEELELSVRSSNCLKNANIKYIGELVQKTEAEMLKTRNFGRKSLNEIKEILQDMGLSLGMKLQGFEPQDKPTDNIEESIE